MLSYSSTSNSSWITFSSTSGATNIYRSTVKEKGWADHRGIRHMTKWRDRGGKAIHVLSIDFDYWYIGDGDPGNHCGFCGTGNEDGSEGIGRPDKLSIGRRPTRTIDYRMVFRRIKEGVPIHVTECHAQIIDILTEIRDRNPDAHICVWNIDEHEDIWGYSSTPPCCHCGSWVDFCGEKELLDEYWWVTDRQHLWQMPERPQAVFLCLSSPYTSEDGDKPFITFIRNLEKRSGMRANVFGHASEWIGEALDQRRDHEMQVLWGNHVPGLAQSQR
jgi:hypothetical protein